jgi:uncharacterized protein
MSQANVEIVRQALDAYTQRDVEALRALADPDMELDWSASRAWLAGVYRGIDEALRFYAGYFEAFEEIVIEPDRFIDAGDSVVVPNIAHQRGRDGIEVSARSTLVITVRNRKLIRVCLYQETGEALRAVGLGENVGVVRAAFEAWNEGNMDALRELNDPDVIVRAPEGWPEPGPFVGRDAVMRQFEQMRETWEAEALEAISDFMEVGDRVAVRQLWHGAGHGPEANLEMTAVWTVRKGRIVFTEFFWDHAEALEAVGLVE